MARSKGEFVQDVLTVCLNGARKTKIVYKANSNFKRVTACLDSLKRAGLIEELDERTYKTTAKGVEFISQQSAINQLLINIY